MMLLSPPIHGIMPLHPNRALQLFNLATRRVTGTPPAAPGKNAYSVNTLASKDVKGLSGAKAPATGNIGQRLGAHGLTPGFSNHNTAVSILEHFRAKYPPYPAATERRCDRGDRVSENVSAALGRAFVTLIGGQKVLLQAYQPEHQNHRVWRSRTLS